MSSTIQTEPSISARAAMDEALQALQRSRARWATLPPAEKAALLEEVLRDLHGVAEPWANACADAKGLDRGTGAAAEEWLAVAFLLRAITLLRSSLLDIAAGRPPRIPGPVRAAPNGGLAVQVFPGRIYDRIFYPGMTAEIWTEPGITGEALRAGQLDGFRGEDTAGKTVLVLGAGNMSLLGPCDVLNKLICEGAVVVYKTHPVLDYLTPLLERAFGAFIRDGFLQVVRGGAAEGTYLAAHELVDELHLTGSRQTHDAIVFGTGEDVERRRAAQEPINTRRFTSELGNVSPVIVVPGPWSPGDFAWQGEHLAGMLTINAGFNCLTTRVIIQHAAWQGRNALLDALRRVLSCTSSRRAYYPGATEVHREFTSVHRAETYGSAGNHRLPWTLIPGIDATQTDDICFQREAFCSLFAETALERGDTANFVDRAVAFANNVLAGSLTATILVHPKSMRDRRVAQAVHRAVADLRYGTVGVNAWGMLNYITMAGSWGAYPGHTPYDIGSGSGAAHNYLMVPRPEKTVFRAPFRQWPKPVIFPSHRALLDIGRRLVDFEAAPGRSHLPGLLRAAFRG
jgi:acyl-CoA reductase-like NAD-dependent aldehyde dehydrogenase